MDIHLQRLKITPLYTTHNTKNNFITYFCTSVTTSDPHKLSVPALGALFIFKFDDISNLIQKIESWKNQENKEDIVSELSNKVISGYSVSNVIEKIYRIFDE